LLSPHNKIQFTSIYQHITRTYTEKKEFIIKEKRHDYQPLKSFFKISAQIISEIYYSNYFCSEIKRSIMKDYNYTLEISANQEEVFNALTNAFQIELWTGYPATMDDQVGTVFSLWEGDISGCNIQVVKDYKLVQEWFFGETENPSIVTFTLKKAGKNTSLELTHTNIPDEAYEEIVEGWTDYYLGSMKNFLEFY